MPLRFLFVTLSFLVCSLYAEPYKNQALTDPQIDSTSYKEKKKDLSFLDAERPEKEEKEKKETTKNVETDFSWLVLVLKTFAILLFVALVVILLYFFTNKKETLKDKKIARVKLNEALEQAEQEGIDSVDFHSMLEDAIKREDYALAVRIQYLQVLQILDEKGLINWKKDKTNHDYSKEVKGQTLSELFSNITYVFDYVWYGEKVISENEYQEYNQKFKALFAEVGNE